jgi:hypothetical protein
VVLGVEFNPPVIVVDFPGDGRYHQVFAVVCPVSASPASLAFFPVGARSIPNPAFETIEFPRIESRRYPIRPKRRRVESNLIAGAETNSPITLFPFAAAAMYRT